MSDALIASQNTRISQLEREAAELRAEAKKYRTGRRDALAERDALKAQIDQLTADRDGWKQKAEATPGETQAKLEALQGQLRQRDHLDTFKAEALKAGVNPAAVADLYRLSGLTPPEEGEPKPEDFAGFLASAKTERAWAFGTGASGTATPGGDPGTTSPQGGAQQGLTLGANPPPPGSGRNASGTTAGQVRYTRTEVQAPGWQHSRPELKAALAEGRAVLVEG
jgi:FtsZ-binding cell division protein ZapB